MRTIEIRIEFPWSLAGVRIACAALTTLNRLWLRSERVAGVEAPSLYTSGVRYARQRGPERFQWIPRVRARRHGDCDQLACWRAAELQEAGIDARAVPKKIGPNLIHIVVEHPGGFIEDPSKRLGM